MDKSKIIQEIFSKKFIKCFENKISDLAGDLMGDNPEEYGGKWDANPYGVDFALIGSSGCYEFTEEAENDAFNDALDKFVNDKDILTEYIYDYALEETAKLLDDENHSKEDEDWVVSITAYALSTTLKKD